MALYVRVRLNKERVSRARLMQVARRILEAAGEAESELSIEIVGDRRIRSLNRRYRAKDRPTDVLAFPMRESANPHPTMLGDVVVSLPTAVRQAKEGGRSADEEVVALLVHGILHLCGYDHERGEREARRMARRERMLLQAIRPIPRLITKSDIP